VIGGLITSTFLSLLVIPVVFTYVDFVPVAQELDLAALGGVRFVFPHAPLRPVTMNGGFVMRAWVHPAPPP
jgi:hypothetical protein